MTRRPALAAAPPALVPPVGLGLVCGLVLALALGLVLGCSRSAPRAEATADATASAPTSAAALPKPSASASSDPGGGLLAGWAKEDALPLGELFDKSTFLTGAIFRRISKKHDRSGLASLTDVERNIFLSYTIDAEERFGTFSQYFAGEAGDRAAPTLAALQAIGAAPFASVVERALAVFPNKAPAADVTARLKQIKAIPAADRAKWPALDKEFKSLPELGKTYIDPYARAHRADLEASNPR